MEIECPICGDTNASCERSGDSDGVAWSWVTWSHYCPHCKYAVKKIEQFTYNQEDTEHCTIPGHQPVRPWNRPVGIGRTDIVWGLNRDINDPDGELTTKIRELEDQLRSLAEFDRRTSTHGKVFISYSHADADIVSKLSTRFDADGIDYWLDEKELLVGEVIERAISEGIQESWLFLIVITPNSINSRWVERELDEASHEEVEGRKIVLPVVAKWADPKKIPPRLRRKLYVNVTADFDAGYSRLRDSIHRYRQRSSRRHQRFSPS